MMFGEGGGGESGGADKEFRECGGLCGCAKIRFQSAVPLM